LPSRSRFGRASLGLGKCQGFLSCHYLINHYIYLFFASFLEMGFSVLIYGNQQA
jgi:hypothetical protein